MNRKKITFKWVYLTYLLLLLVLVAAALLYVRSLLGSYEGSQPETHARRAAAQLASDAAAGESFWEKYALPSPQPGRFEQDVDLEASYLALYAGEELEISPMSGRYGEDELYYSVERDGFPLAEIKLKAAGPPVTKLAVFTLREWTVEHVRPLLEQREYALTVPDGFSAAVNGVPLTAADGAAGDGGERTYTIAGLYLQPRLSITDQQGNDARYTIKDGRILVEYYSYSLTLPSILTVRLNGQPFPGEDLGDGLTRYAVTTLTKPEVVISDHYGNELAYEGGSELPLTYMTITASDRYAVTVSGQAAPPEALTTVPNPAYAQFAGYVQGLPQVCTYRVAVLKENAQVAVTDELGRSVPLEEGKTAYDFTGRADSLAQVPEEVASQVDVLDVAQRWSLLMTNDLPFSQLSRHLIAGSYQYDVARSYATGVDITFTSRHSLLDPPFTENTVTNFVWITDNCFSVDISFVKHMRLYYGALVDDPMNDRFYFVLYDDTDNGVDDPAWKLAGMKEIVDNGPS